VEVLVGFWGRRMGVGREGGMIGAEGNYISGSLDMSAMAAMGMPKLEAGPQKS
jgi:hypothetical protein